MSIKDFIDDTVAYKNGTMRSINMEEIHTEAQKQQMENTMETFLAAIKHISAIKDKFIELEDAENPIVNDLPYFMLDMAQMKDISVDCEEKALIVKHLLAAGAHLFVYFGENSRLIEELDAQVMEDAKTAPKN